LWPRCFPYAFHEGDIIAGIVIFVVGNGEIEELRQIDPIHTFNGSDESI
jgi:hypothetical protein